MKLALFEHFVKLIVKYCKLRASKFHYGWLWAVLYHGSLKGIVGDQKAVVKLHNFSCQALVLLRNETVMCLWG